jgi:hypothetical protein
MQLIASKRGHRTSSEQRVPPLPVELWTAILKLILNESAEPYKYCTANTFPLYQAYYFNACLQLDTNQCIDRRNIRLVCRTWYHISGPPRRAGLQTLKQPPRPQICHINVYHSMVHLVGWVYAAQNITTLVLSNKAFNKRRGVLFFLFRISQRFLPALRSFAVDAGPFPPAHVYPHLQATFPLLVSLTFLSNPRPNYWLDMNALPTSFTLSHLRQLDIDWSHSVTFQFPELKHLCIRNIIPDTFFMRFLNDHGQQLESFLMPNPYWYPDELDKEQEFWDLCPNLLTFGSSYSSLTQIQGPLASHPLKHLRIFLPSSLRMTADIDRELSKLRPKFPRLKRIFINNHTPLCKPIMEYCMAQGLAYAIVPSPSNGSLKAMVRVAEKIVFSAGTLLM